MKQDGIRAHANQSVKFDGCLAWTPPFVGLGFRVHFDGVIQRNVTSVLTGQLSLEQLERRLRFDGVIQRSVTSVLTGQLERHLRFDAG
jgi:hypothetical protein